MGNPESYSNRFIKVYNNFSFAIACNWFLAQLSAARPGKHSHHLFQLYNEFSIVTLWVWILSGLSCLAVHLLKPGPFFGISQVNYMAIFHQVILTVVVLWVMYMFLELDCSAEMAKFLGCRNVKTRSGGVSWTERCEIVNNPVKIDKRPSISLALAFCDAMGPTTFYLSLYLVFYLANHSLVSLSWMKIISCVFILFMLWLYWAVLYFLSFRTIGGLILKHNVFKNHPNLKADGFNILWKVFVQKTPTEKIESSTPPAKI